MSIGLREHAMERLAKQAQERAHAQVLVVEDDGALRDFLRDALTDEGFDVLLAADGAAALDLLSHAELGERHTPSVILTDTIMPRMDGWKFIRAYRQLPPPHAPIISMGFGGGVEGETEPPAVDAVVAKPFNLDELLDLISRCAAS